MGDDVEADLPSQRPQYHYFYGSTDDSGDVPARLGASSPSAATDQDSLVGESLIPTDNEHEDETPHNSAQDFQQLLMTKGNGVHSILGPNGNKGSRNSRPWLQRLSMAQFRETHPIIHVFLLIGSICLFFIIFSVIVFPDSMSANLAATPQSELSFRMPFPRVDRAQFNDPVSNFIQKDLFNPKLIYKGKDPSREFTFPFPTGAFWTNLVLPPTGDRGLSYPIAVYPYAYKWSKDIIEVSYPAQHRREESKAIHDYFFPDLTFGIVENSSKRTVESFDALSITLRYSAMNGGSFETYLVQGSPYITVKYDNASPRIRAFSIFKSVFCPRDEDEQKISLDNENQRRRLRYGVCYSIPSENGDDSTTLTGVQFILQTQEGMNWIVFTSEPITLLFDTITKTTVVSAEPFKGVLRLALIPPSTSTSSSDDSIQIASSTGLQRLIYHAGVYPVSGAVSWSFREADSNTESTLALAARTISGLGGSLASSSSSSSSSSSTSSSSSGGRVGSIHFEFATSSFTPTSSASTPKALLMLALPHHAESLSSSVQLNHDKFDIVYKCIKGPMRPVLGSSWMYDEPLPNLGFDGDRGSSSKHLYMNSVVRSRILESLRQDIRLALPSLTENIYGFGKQAARLAQLAHIASMLQFRNTTYTAVNITGHGGRAHSHERVQDPAHDEAATLLQEAVDLLTNALEHLLTSNVSDSLVYDANLGGLVTTNGLMDPEADFGNGRYNDHHFHYGYTLYACAILGKLNATFVEKYSDSVDALYYDIAHDSNMDSRKADGVFFPGSRQKAWFDGHSFASGLFPFSNGKSQESSSEAVNAYYGAYLWSLVRNGAASNPESDVSEQTDFARLLLASEIRGVRTYWHMIPPGTTENHTSDSLSTVYSPSFSKNYMVGNLGMLDAVCSTWFGTESLYVHMINFIPITSITGELFDEKYVTQEYKKVLEPLGQVEMAWRGYVVCNHAIVDADAAWQEAQSLQGPQLDSALSKSQVLYWIATRSGFNAMNMTAPAADSDGPSKHESGSGGGATACESHAACSGLIGDCCPTGDGSFLECCNSRL